MWWIVVATVVAGAMVATPADAQRRRRPRSAGTKPAGKPAPTPAGPTASSGAGVHDPVTTPTAPDADPARGVEKPGTGGSDKPKVFDFTGLDINGRLRTPQLLYFLDRANEELERASLERRSFVPEMVRSVDESSM